MIQLDRIQSDLHAIARCTLTPGHGATRPTFSDAWGAARDDVIEQATRAGAIVRIDAAGNVFAKPSSLPIDARTWLVGSHIDTVPYGGDYDGVAGIVVALELLRSAIDDGFAALPVELVIFAEEEGPTFGLGMLGSRVLAGEIGASELGAIANSDGQSYLEAGKRFGVDPDGLAAAKLDPSKHHGLVELHIEQGPGMWRRDQRLAVVTAIAGRRQYKLIIEGEANHAGATSMTDRRDAVAAASECVVGLETLARELSPDTVITVGRLIVTPNAVNVIASRVECTIDFRSPTDAILDSGDSRLRSLIEGIAARRNVTAMIETSEAIAARPMSSELVQAFRSLGVTHTAVSGALHDSAVLAPLVPTVMLFVPSLGGISHNPAEFSRVEDIAAATQVIERFVRRPTIARLNEMDRDAFVHVVGPVFEESPWIAERAYESRPFTSLDDLLKSMTGIVCSASESEQIGLLRAHPDLVGRLARENRLTPESTTEQAAAGLTNLSAAEVGVFESYNAAYRERFGFPFIICARANKKDAILAAFPTRLENSRKQEIETALAEVYKIAELRLRDAIVDES